MALPEFSMRQLLESGVHFGHQTYRWNPKMAPYIFGERSSIHILDLSQTVPLLHQALVKVRDTAAKGGRVLFVGTKRQASDSIRTSATRCAQYYVDHRWLGGMLTNWQTISASIRRLKELEGLLSSDSQKGLTKKELLGLTRELDKLERTLGGIKDMGKTPDLMFVVDTNKESIAIQEARKLGIPVIALFDSNCNPEVIDFPIPANDDSVRSIALFCDLLADAALDGMQEFGFDATAIASASEAPAAPAVKIVEDATAIASAPEAPAAPAVKIVEDATAIASAPEAPAAPAVKIVEASAPIIANLQTKNTPGQAEQESTPEQVVSIEMPITLISGLGAMSAKKLNDAGIHNIAQLAALSGEEIETLNDKLALRSQITKGEWVQKAKNILKNK